MTYAVIMAGGIGSRFWPASRRESPKQFLRILSDTTLIQNTVARLQGLIAPERCFVVTHERYVEQTADQLPAIPSENILAEPVSRNTAPCILFAALKLLAEDPEAVMVVLPADHVIKNARQFQDVLGVAIEKAREPSAIVTIGINPTHPETGYGYIQFDGQIDPGSDAIHPYRVRTFAEKPDLPTAERFLDSGDFLWNSGMFIWKAGTIVEQVHRFLPEVYDAFKGYQEALGTERESEETSRAFENSPRISIDYGVMERAENVWVVPGSFGWSDVGDWRAVYHIAEKNNLGNSLNGTVIAHDSSRCYVQSDHRLVVLVGIHDTIVVDTEDAILICNRQNAQQVKNVVDYLYAHRMEEYI